MVAHTSPTVTKKGFFQSLSLRMAYRAAVELGAEAAQAWGGAGWAAFLAKRNDAARWATRQGLKANPSDTLRGLLLYNLGRIQQEEGNRKEAIHLYQKSLKLRPHKKVEKRLNDLLRASATP